MNKAVVIAAILTTLAEEPDGSAPANIAYMLMNMDYAASETVLRMMVAGGLIDRTSQRVTITEAGREMAKKIEALKRG